jgi:RHS repeat-associated protein
MAGTGIIFSPIFTSSIREMTNSSGVIQAQLSYDLYGRVTQLQGTIPPDFQFGDYYLHTPSGLNLTLTRAYSSSQGRFINRDSIGEVGGINLYAYMRNHPEIGVDPNGTCAWAVGLGGAITVGGTGGGLTAGAISTGIQGLVGLGLWLIGQGAGAGAGSGTGGTIDCNSDPCQPGRAQFQSWRACYDFCDKHCSGLRNAACKVWCVLGRPNDPPLGGRGIR